MLLESVKLVDSWTQLVERTCVTCKSKFSVQYQSTIRPNGGMYCTKKCNPNANTHLQKYIAHELGPVNTAINVKCKCCGNEFKTKVKNIRRGGGSYCSRKCNPAYAKKFDKATRARRHNLKANYGLTTEEYDVMLENQGGVCAICGSKPRDILESRHARLHVDHDHETGKVRELLCSSCNRALGWFREDKFILRNAINYLSKHEIHNKNDNQADALALLHYVLDPF